MTLETENSKLQTVLESPKCFCGNVKKLHQPFCGRCFYALPAAARTFVKYIRNDTYHGTYNAALDLLRKQHVNQST